MKYTAAVFTGTGYHNKYIGEITAATLPSLKAKASRLCNGYFNTADRIEVKYTGEIVTTEYLVTFHRYNKKSPDNTITRGQWR